MTKKKILIAAFALIAVLSVVLAGCAGKVNGLTGNTCEVENCNDSTHAHNVCGAEDCATISDHAHDGACTSASCTQEGAHSHFNAGGCSRTDGQHSGCGTNNSTDEGEHIHGMSGSNNSGNGNGGRGCCSKNS